MGTTADYITLTAYLKTVCHWNGLSTLGTPMQLVERIACELHKYKLAQATDTKLENDSP